MSQIPTENRPLFCLQPPAESNVEPEIKLTACKDLLQTHHHFPPALVGRVPDVVGHLVAHEPLDMLRLDPIGVLAVDGLPAGVVEPSAAHYFQPRPWPVHGVALPLVEVDLVDASTNHNVEVSVVPDQLLRPVMPLADLPVAGCKGRRELSPAKWK